VKERERELGASSPVNIKLVSAALHYAFVVITIVSREKHRCNGGLPTGFFNSGDIKVAVVYPQCLEKIARLLPRERERDWIKKKLKSTNEPLNINMHARSVIRCVGVVDSGRHSLPKLFLLPCY
jgi:hypothetical protein